MRRVLLLLAALCALAAGCGGQGGGDGNGSADADQASGTPSPTATATATPSQAATREQVSEGSGSGFDAEGIYREEAPGVVTVVSLFGSGGGIDELLGGGGGGGGGVGSGFVLDDRGEIATNAHVVMEGSGAAARRASEVYVEFADGNRVPARILGTDPNADIALLKVDPAGLDLHPLPLGRSDEVTVGEPVAAIGSPFGERQSLSVGVVSAVDRSIQSLTDFEIPGAVQTDAAINPGNSGGPLLDADGAVIGVNEQIKTNSGGGEGVGFAVPVDLVKRSLAQLRESGEATYAYLGVSSIPLYPQLVDHFGLDVDQGAWVQDVIGAPAREAGLRGGSGQERFQGSDYRPGGDIITELEGTPILESDDLSTALARFRPGEMVTLEVHRDGETREIQVELGERPAGVSSQSGG